MKASFGGKDPYDNDYDPMDEFSIDPFVEEYQPHSSIHPNRLGGSHFYIRPSMKSNVNAPKQEKKPPKLK